MTIGERIKKKREEKGWTQSELARKMGYADRSAIAMVECGKRNVDNENIIKYADILGTTPTYLLGWERKGEFSEGEQELLNEIAKNDNTKFLLLDYALKLKEVLK